MRGSYYIGMALQAMERAYEQNHDSDVGMHISNAIYALRELVHQDVASTKPSEQAELDPYEINEFNSAV